MPIYNRIAELHADMQEWRRDFHVHPELSFEETRTAGIVATKLREWGLEVHEGIGVTGVVGVLKGQGSSGRTIGIRADMDALPLQEMTDHDYPSAYEGKMHACGHDGHTAILLGAARYLAETQNFDGTVHFIFQPAEEGGGGAEVMVKEGLFERFPCDGVYGLHNQPMMPKGQFLMKSGTIMGSIDTARVTIKGKGGHAAHPQLSLDPIVVGVQLHVALQTIVSRNVSPVDNAVISVCMFQAGTADNVIADTASMTASIRCTSSEIRDLLEKRFREVCAGVAETYQAQIDVEYERQYPCTVNHQKETDIIAKAAKEVVGDKNVDTNVSVRLGSEDFSYMLEKCPGAYIFMGTNEEDCYPVHHPKYDFNDDLLSHGASLWAKLVEQEMPRS